MSEQKKTETSGKPGIEVDTLTFDESGNVQGLDDSALNDVAGGVMHADFEAGTDKDCTNILC